MCRYCVHTLATRHRDVEAGAVGGAGDGAGAGLELGTPVLARAQARGSALLPVSCAWLVAGAAPPLYTTPKQPPHYAGTRPHPHPRHHYFHNTFL